MKASKFGLKPVFNNRNPVCKKNGINIPNCQLQFQWALLILNIYFEGELSDEPVYSKSYQHLLCVGYKCNKSNK